MTEVLFLGVGVVLTIALVSNVVAKIAEKRGGVIVNLLVFVLNMVLVVAVVAFGILITRFMAGDISALAIFKEW